MIRYAAIFLLITASGFGSLDRTIIDNQNIGVVIHRSASDNVVTTPGTIDGTDDGAMNYWSGTQMAWSDPLKLHWDDPNGLLSVESVAISDLTATRVVFVGASGLLVDNPAFTFITDTLLSPNVTASGTVTAEQLTSTDDITMQGHTLSLGDDSSSDIFILFKGDSLGTLTYDSSSFSFSNDGGDADLDIQNDISAGGDVNAEFFVADRDAGSVSLPQYSFSSAATGRDTGMYFEFTGPGPDTRLLGFAVDGALKFSVQVNQSPELNAFIIEDGIDFIVGTGNTTLGGTLDVTGNSIFGDVTEASTTVTLRNSGTDVVLTSTTGLLTIDQDVQFDGKGIFGQAGSTADVILSVGTDDTNSQSLPSFVEIISNAANPMPDALSGGLYVESAHNITSSAAPKGAGFFTERSAGDVGAIGVGNAQRVGLFGGVGTEFSNTSAFLRFDAVIRGLQFSAANKEDWIPTHYIGGTSLLTVFGMDITSTLGWNGKTISGDTLATGCAANLDAKMDGTYDSVVEGENCAVKAITTDDLDGGSGDIVSYGVFIDACASSADIGGGGALTSWGLYEVNGRNNALAGNTRIGSLGIPTSLLHIGDGTNESVFSATGVLTMAGDGRVIKHLHFDMALGKGQNAPTERYSEDPYISYTYATNDDSHLTREAPDNMDYTEPSIIKIHWYTTDATAVGVDEVRWEVQWASQAIGEDITAGDTTDNSGDIVCSAQNIIVETTVLTIPANSIDLVDVLGIHIKRVVLGDGTNPQVNTIHVCHVEIEYVSNKLGEAL